MAQNEKDILESLTPEQIEKLKALLTSKEKKEKTLSGQKAFLDAMKKKNAIIIKIEGYKYVKSGDSLIPQRGMIAEKSHYGTKAYKESSVSAYKKAVEMLHNGDV